MNRHKLTIQPENREVEVLEGSTVMDALNDAGLEFDFPCGGMGTCGKCRIKMLAGIEQPTISEQELLEQKELNEGMRLACQTTICADSSIEISNYRPLEHNILALDEERFFHLEPHMKKIFIQVDKPSLQEHLSDWQRVKDGLKKHGCSSENIEVAVTVLRQLPDTVREAKDRITIVMYGNKAIGIERQDTTDTMLGMAFDIGTTTIVGYLLDLNSGEVLSVASKLNPQTKFGADVISRINFAGQEEQGLEKLHSAVIEAINSLIEEAAGIAGVNRGLIYGVSIAANTTMHHLFVGINPRNIAVSPYVSATNDSLVIDALELGININQAGKVFVLPNIAGFVGADTMAVLLATELDRSDNVKLIIDIGTNGEIALGSKEKMVVCSAAAGPAFEGAHISSGMRGAVGAIDHVYFVDGLSYSVIGGGRPAGICGSALLDGVAGLIELGIIDKRGRFLAPDKLTNPRAIGLKDKLVQYDGAGAFLLAPADITDHGRPIMITQKDIRELQLAKGAMAAGVNILLESCGVEMGDIKEVLLAGAFGNYLNPHSACVIGLIPRELEGKIKMIGNAAGTGAKLALLSAGEFSRADAIAAAVRFVELGSYPKFNSIFAENTYFKQV